MAGVGLCLALLVQFAVLSVGFIQDTPGGLEHYVLRPDFIVSVTGAEMLLRGEGTHLYDEAAQRVVEESVLREGGIGGPVRLLGYNHPPFVSVIVAALRLLGLPYSTIFLLWTFLRLAAFALALWMLSRAWAISGVSRLLCALVAFAFYPVVVSLQVGQPTAFVVLGWAAGSAALRMGKERSAGVWLSLVALKPQHLPVILLALAVMRRWKALAAFAITAGIATIAVMPFAGWDWPFHYVQLLLKQAAQPPNVVIDPAMMQNWRGFFMRVLNFSPSARTYAILATIFTIIAVAVVWWLATRRPNRQHPRSALSPQPSVLSTPLWAFTLCAALLASYHLLYPDLALAIVPGWIIARMALSRPVSDPARWLWLGWLWIGWTLGFVVNYQTIQVALAPAWLAITAVCLLVPAFAGRRRIAVGSRQ